MPVNCASNERGVKPVDCWNLQLITAVEILRLPPHLSVKHCSVLIVY